MTRTTRTMQEVSDALVRTDGYVSDHTKAVLAGLIDPAKCSKGGTVKAWFQAHHGAVVDSVVATTYNVWPKGGRTVDSRSKAGEAHMDGSAMEYKGKVIHADSDTLLFSYDFGGECWALYTVVK